MLFKYVVTKNNLKFHVKNYFNRQCRDLSEVTKRKSRDTVSNTIYLQ
jgi:hypothetical protein